MDGSHVLGLLLMEHGDCQSLMVGAGMGLAVLRLILMYWAYMREVIMC